MPVIIPNLGVGNTVSNLVYARDDAKDDPSHGTSNTVVWIVAAVVGGLIIIGSVAAGTLICYSKRRQRRLDQELHPYLTGNGIIKRRKTSDVDNFRDDEERRKHMIRKSLATRSSGSAGSGFSAMMDLVDRELAQLERQEEARLKEDWKKWEAKERRERSMSGGQHPATSAASSAASSVPVLAIPTPAKHRHDRTASVSPPPSPRLPARHPGRRSPT